MTSSRSSKSSSRKRSTASVHSKEAAALSLLPARPPLRPSLHLGEKREQQAAVSAVEVKARNAAKTTPIANDSKKTKSTSNAPKGMKSAAITGTITKPKKVSAKPDAPRTAAPEPKVESDFSWGSKFESSMENTASKKKKAKPRKKKKNAKMERERWPGKRKLDYINTEPVWR